MRDRHPLLVLSPKAFNEKTALVVGLPMTTAAYNATNPFAVALGDAGKSGEKTSYILCHQPKSFDWRARSAEPHPAGKVPPAAFKEACEILEQIIQVSGSGA
jgi:mRNA interferase MazF